MRTSKTMTNLAWIAVASSILQNTGRQIDWRLVPSTYDESAWTVTLTAQANAAATSMTVAALDEDVYPGTLMYFGEAGEYARCRLFSAKGTTTLYVDALPAQIESGDTGKIGRGGELFIPAGTIMAEIVAAPGKVVPRAAIASTAWGTAVAAAVVGTGDGTISAVTVNSDAKVGTYIVKLIQVVANKGLFQVTDPNGVIIGTNYVGVAFNTEIGFTITDGATDFVVGDYFSIAVTMTYIASKMILLTDARNNTPAHAKTGYGMAIGGHLFENLLPEASGSPKVLSATIKKELKQNGCSFTFEQYGDSRVS